MWCDPPLFPSTEINRSKSLNEKKQLSFIYQPGVGLYDKKKVNLDEDLRINDVDERKQTNESSSFISNIVKQKNEQDSIPIREILSDKNHQIKLLDVDISTNQENHQKRKFHQITYSNKKYCQSNENLLDGELHHQQSKLIPIEEEKPKQQSLPIKLRKNSNEKIAKQTIPPIVKSIPMVKRLSSEREGISIPSQGLLLCPKEEPIKKQKKKKKIAPMITSNTELLDDDPVLDSILFDEMQSVQQQWQQFLILTMEKELHTNTSDGKKKMKLNKFNRTNEFLLAYESLYDFEGMKHWCPTFR